MRKHEMPNLYMAPEEQRQFGHRWRDDPRWLWPDEVEEEVSHNVWFGLAVLAVIAVLLVVVIVVVAPAM